LRPAIPYLLSAILLFIAGCDVHHVNLPPNQPVDMLDYLLQSDDPHNQWTLGGFDTHLCSDPDGTATPCFTLTKFSDPNYYELYKVTPDQIQLRYEVSREGKGHESENWIRRFEELNGQGAAPGAIWCPRIMTPAGSGFLSHFRQDRFIFDPSSHSYVIDKPSSSPDMSTWLTISYAINNWGRYNKSGLKLNPVIRLTSQWQHEGLIFETYDYAQGKGIVAWRWYERLSTLTPKENDPTHKIFHCESGYVLVESVSPPLIYQYDAEKNRKGRQLETLQFTSHWQPEKGAQTYVIFRDTTKESPLLLHHEDLPVDFALHEWTSKPNATIKDLSYLHTHPPISK